MRPPVRRRLDRIDARLEKIARSLPRLGEGETSVDQRRQLREIAIEYVSTLFEVIAHDERIPASVRERAKPLLASVK